MRILVAMLALVVTLAAADIRLYLKDGGTQRVREYEVLADRVRYYSTERGDWEEIPLELVDLKKTKAVQAQVEADKKRDAAESAEEDRAEEEAAKEVASVPKEVGVYWVRSTGLQALKPAEMKVNTSKKRQILKVMSPLPLVPGKATVEIDGTASEVHVPPGRPEFYLRVETEEPFAIVKLTPEKKVRIVERVAIIPVTNEYMEDRTPVEMFRRQVGEGLFKLWPQKPMDPGEYAIIQYDDGKVKLQVWDFAIANPPLEGVRPDGKLEKPRKK
ncbi:MAG: hypothetical protein ABI823_15970 [Bryobacteraceae bacterium]